MGCQRLIIRFGYDNDMRLSFLFGCYAKAKENRTPGSHWVLLAPWVLLASTKSPNSHMKRSDRPRSTNATAIRTRQTRMIISFHCRKTAKSGQQNCFGGSELWPGLHWETNEKLPYEELSRAVISTSYRSSLLLFDKIRKSIITFMTKFVEWRCQPCILTIGGALEVPQMCLCLEGTLEQPYGGLRGACLRCAPKAP